MRDISEFEIAAAMAAFAEESLRNRMETEQRDVFLIHIVHDLRERMKFCAGLVHIFLVHLVGENREPMCFAKPMTILMLSARKNRTGRIARIDHGDCNRMDSRRCLAASMLSFRMSRSTATGASSR